MRICILGAGALGSAIGGTLAEAGHDVTLVNRNRLHVEAIRERGLVLRSDGRDRVVRLAATTDTAGLSAVDLVIVLVKALDTEAAALAARTILAPNTVVMSLQNGLGQEEVLTSILGHRHVVGGRTYAGGVMLGPGHVLSGVGGKETIIGELDGVASLRVAALAEGLTAAGVETRASAQIWTEIWDKLLVNVSTGALAAVTGLTYGQLYQLPEIEEMAVAAVAEAMDVARALDIPLMTRDPQIPWLKAAAGLPPEFKTSMLQSLENGRRTEIDFINGAVLREGRRAGVPTPVNAALVALVRAIELKIPVPEASAA
ncbi:MAG: ketopantoate reductase family protein [Bosea sp. (in: a-proteobacteria)]|uniref:ketopantoate reductase family protein n=1 Tax=Bosea sp. (in: a-proteobacteria) TaxID=1871050 RepID=UPI003F7C39F7